MINRYRLSAWWVVCVLLFSPLALAQQNDFNQFNPEHGDAAIDYMRDIFGGIVDAVYTGKTDNTAQDSTIGAFMTVFGAGAYFLGMIFLVYNAVRGMVDSAEDGSFLGKKASSAWLPMRLAVGAGLLAPTGSGFSLIQVLVIWLALQGVGMGTKSFVAILNFFEDTQMVLQPKLPDARPLVISVARSELCMATMNQYYADIESSTRVNLEDRIFTQSAFLSEDISFKEFAWNAVGGDDNGQSICGRTQIRLTWPGDESKLKEPMMKAQTEGLVAVIAQVRPHMRSMVETGEAPDPAFIQQAVSLYTNVVASAASTAVKETNAEGYTAFIKHAEEGGFLYAGTWIGHINRMNDAVQGALNELPTQRSFDLSKHFDEASLQTYRDQMVKLEALYNTADKSISDAYQNNVGNLGAGEGVIGSVREAISSVFLGLTNYMTNAIAGDNLTHLSQMKSFGDTLILAAEAASLTMAVASGGAGGKVAEYTVGLAFSLPAALQSLGGLLTAATISLFTFGISLSVYIPFVPLISWIMACLNWMLMLIEAVIAGPLFAAAHMHPDGDERIGNAGEGYRMLLNLVMRPSLMVIALVTSIVLSNGIAGMINAIFMPYVQAMQSGSLVGVVKFIGLVAVYTFLMISVVHACNALIHLLPDRVMLYLGRSIAGLGGSERVEAETKAGMDRFGAGAYTAGRSGLNIGQKPPGATDNPNSPGKPTKDKPANNQTM